LNWRFFWIFWFNFSGHGFGFNTNILETNVINLAVVIAVVVVWRRSARIIKK
jgi:hypothetical protein